MNKLFLLFVILIVFLINNVEGFTFSRGICSNPFYDNKEDCKSYNHLWTPEICPGDDIEPGAKIQDVNDLFDINDNMNTNMNSNIVAINENTETNSINNLNTNNTNNTNNSNTNNSNNSNYSNTNINSIANIDSIPNTNKNSNENSKNSNNKNSNGNSNNSNKDKNLVDYSLKTIQNFEVIEKNEKCSQNVIDYFEGQIEKTHNIQSKKYQKLINKHSDLSTEHSDLSNELNNNDKLKHFNKFFYGLIVFYIFIILLSVYLAFKNTKIPGKSKLVHYVLSIVFAPLYIIYSLVKN